MRATCPAVPVLVLRGRKTCRYARPAHMRSMTAASPPHGLCRFDARVASCTRMVPFAAASRASRRWRSRLAHARSCSILTLRITRPSAVSCSQAAARTPTSNLAKKNMDEQSLRFGLDRKNSIFLGTRRFHIHSLKTQFRVPLFPRPLSSDLNILLFGRRRPTRCIPHHLKNFG